jgi:hypothetical protein
LQQGKREAGGFSRPGLGGAEKVAAGEDYGDGLQLDGGRGGIALVCDSAQKLGRKPKRVERSNEKSPALGLGRGRPFDRFRQMRFELVLRRSGMDPR